MESIPLKVRYIPIMDGASSTPTLTHDGQQNLTASSSREKLPASATGSPKKTPSSLDRHDTLGTETKLDHQQPEGEEWLTGFKLWAVFTCLMLSVFLIALDQTILSPALVSRRRFGDELVRSSVSHTSS